MVYMASGATPWGGSCLAVVATTGDGPACCRRSGDTSGTRSWGSFPCRTRYPDAGWL